jgi:hypothetical protein
MNLSSYQQIIHSRPLRLGSGNDIILYRHTMGLILFLQQILWIIFNISAKAIIFVRLFLYRKIFDLVYMQFDRRKFSAVWFKPHRLLHFTRGVGLFYSVATIRQMG